ncbi:uncharacterized protein LOC134672214 [Cydia fagiglandana]|uniref:uncharacterized protein LOC134672214 n=1 Tax=Cydia fagiglandana TaxID=1458189 RepID=UPI002FEE5FA5
MKLYNQAFIIILCIAISQAFDESAFYSEKETLNLLTISFTHTDQTIFIDIDNDSSVIFKDALLKCIHDQNHSVILLNDVPDFICEGKIVILEENPSIVFTIKYLHHNVLDNPLLKSLLKSHWSPLFIVVTTEDSLYKCVDGKLNEEAVNNIEGFLNDLWHKYRIMHAFLNLPYVCPNEYVVYDGIKSNEGELYNRTIKLIREEQLPGIKSKKASRMLTRNYPLRGNIFYRFPTAIQECEGTDIYIKTSQKTSGGFCGLDGLVMSDIVTHFKFNLSLPSLGSDSLKYGYQQQDGVITGSLGHIVRKDVDLSFNSRFMTKYITGQQKYIFLYPVANDALCVVLKQPEEEPLWRYPINAFSIPQWIFILACLTSIGVIMWAFAKIKYKINNTRATLLSYVLNSINAGLFGFFFKRRTNLLLFRASCLYASIMLLAEYQGYINYIFTTRVRYDVLYSLSQFAESGTVIQTSPSIYTFINETVNEVGEVLLSRMILMENTDSFEYVVHHSNTATLERKTDAIMWILMKYTDGSGRPTLYVMDDSVRSFYLAYIANLGKFSIFIISRYANIPTTDAVFPTLPIQSDSSFTYIHLLKRMLRAFTNMTFFTEFPFVGMIDVYIMSLFETGLIDMYYAWTSRALGLQVTLPYLYSEPRPASKIGMKEQVIAFTVLLVGYAASVITFVMEIWFDRRQKYPFIH